MNPLLTLLWGLALALPFLVWVGYNRLVAAKNAVREAWGGVEAQLKRRHDLIPQLVAATRTYASHEQGLFERVAKMRSGFDPEAEAATTQALVELLLTAEAYPELKASANFLNLQKNLAEVEEALALARRYYNGAVRVYNTLLESFPTNLVARAFGFKPAAYFEVPTAQERLRPEVRFEG